MLYSMSNPDWESRGKFKGGFTTDPPKRLYDGHPYHSALSIYKNLYKIIEIDPDKLKKLPFQNQPDRIIFADGLEKRTKLLNSIYECKLVNLELIKPYLISEGGGTEFIKNEGIDIFDKIITEDFPKLGYNIHKLTEEEVNCYNELQYKYIKKNKQENEIEEHKVMVRLNKQYKKQKNKRKKELQKLKEQDLEKYIRIKLGQIPFNDKYLEKPLVLDFGNPYESALSYTNENECQEINKIFKNDFKGYCLLMACSKQDAEVRLVKYCDYIKYKSYDYNNIFKVLDDNNTRYVGKSYIYSGDGVLDENHIKECNTYSKCKEILKPDVDLRDHGCANWNGEYSPYIIVSHMIKIINKLNDKCCREGYYCTIKNCIIFMHV